jgi:hypothetical protein
MNFTYRYGIIKKIANNRNNYININGSGGGGIKLDDIKWDLFLKLNSFCIANPNRIFGYILYSY